MDANYVMDETLGTASYDITKLRVGQTKMESFLIGKVRRSTPAAPLNSRKKYVKMDRKKMCTYII